MRIFRLSVDYLYITDEIWLIVYCGGFIPEYHKCTRLEWENQGGEQ